MISGDVVFVTDAGDCAGFEGGDRDRHYRQKRGDADARVLEIGSRMAGEHALYPDIDMKAEAGVGYVHRDGTPSPKTSRRGPA